MLMQGYFIWVNSLISGTIAGLVAISVTLAIEHLGAIGGVVASLPSTIIPASIGFALEGSLVWADATPDQRTLYDNRLKITLFTVPVGMCINSFFLMCWKYIPPRLPSSWNVYIRLLITSSISLAIWFLISLAVVLTKNYLLQPLISEELMVYVSFSFGLVSISYVMILGLIYCWSFSQDSGQKRKPVKWYVVMSRGFVVAAAISVSVFLSKVSELIAGLIAVFPAIYLTTMVALWISQGESLPISSIGPLLLGSTSVSAYALISPFFLYRWNIIAGVMFSFVCAICLTSMPFFLFLRWRMDRNENKRQEKTQVDDMQEIAAKEFKDIKGLTESK